MKAVIKTVKGIAGHIRELLPHIKIWGKRAYQFAQEEITLAQKLYNKHKLNDIYKSVDNTCITYDSRKKQPKCCPEPTFNGIEVRLLESATNVICRDIDDFIKSRKNRALNAAYLSNPTIVYLSFCYGVYA